MSCEITVLGSSSSGNCALLKTAQSLVLIDAGLSCRRIRNMLATTGIDINNIDAVFITHEHSDHSQGLKGMRRLSRPVYFGNAGTVEALSYRYDVKLPWKKFQTGSCFRFRDLSITSFPVPHDAADPVGFIFESGDGTLFNPYRKVAWATDLGHAPPAVCRLIEDADFLLLEANHDPELLENCKRPWTTKQRIRGRHGHLSNQAALEVLTGANRPRWQQICLAHLSNECNRVDLVRETFSQFGSPTGTRIHALDPGSSEPFSCTIT